MFGFEEAFWALVTAVAVFVTWGLIADLRAAERERKVEQEMLRRLAAHSGGLAEALREAKRHGTLEKVRRDIEKQSPATRANLAGRFKVD